MKNSWYDLGLNFDIAVMTLNLKSCPSYILETVNFRKLMLARDICLGSVAVQCQSVKNFNLFVVTLKFKTSEISETVR